MADKEAARKSGRPLVISRTPDVCKTPIGGATPPVPYPVTTDLSDALKVSSNVRFGGKPAFTFGSQTPDVRGDQAGTAGGVKSGTVGGECKPIRGSNTVRVNGQPVIRHGDPFIMNAGNTTGKLVYVEGGGGVASIDEPTIPPDEDEGFLDWVADTLDAAAEKAQALDEQYAIVTRAEGLAQGVSGAMGVAAGVAGIVAPGPATTAGGVALVAIGAGNAGAGFARLCTGETQQAPDTSEKSETSSKENSKINTNPGDGIKIKGTEKEPPDPNKTRICIGYTKAVGHELHGQYHAFVTAENPLTGEKSITRAGPSADSLSGSSSAASSSVSGGSLSASAGDGGSGGFGFGTIYADGGIWSEKLPFDKPSNTVHQQCEEEIDLPYDQVVDRMEEFEQVTNKNKIPYVPWGPNSNSYAFTFLESLGMPRPEPDLPVLGHDSRLFE